MPPLFLLSSSLENDPKIDQWLTQPNVELRGLAKCWFEEVRQCGNDVREIMHDGRPTACLQNAPFVYVDTFKAHMNLGFFRGAELDDPDSLLVGSGKIMRHIKLATDRQPDANLILQLIKRAYENMKEHLTSIKSNDIQ